MRLELNITAQQHLGSRSRGNRICPCVICLGSEQQLIQSSSQRKRNTSMYHWRWDLPNWDQVNKKSLWECKNNSQWGRWGSKGKPWQGELTIKLHGHLFTSNFLVLIARKDARFSTYLYLSESSPVIFAQNKPQFNALCFKYSSNPNSIGPNTRSHAVLNCISHLSPEILQ